MPNANKLDGVNRWLTLGANIGVVLGLIILIIEVRQNAKLTRVALEAAGIEKTMALELRIADPSIAPIWRKSVLAPESLTDAEMRVVEGILISYLQQWWQLMQMEEEGLVTRARVERGIGNHAPYAFGSKFGQAWWAEEMKTGWTGTPMEEIADPIVRAVDPEFNARRFEVLRAKIENMADTE